MLQTLYFIPEKIGPYPVFGTGLLLVAWAVASVALLGWLVWRQGFTADTWGYVPLLLVFGAVIRWVLPNIVEPGLGLPIRGYGVMMLLGVLAGTSLTIWRGIRLRIAPDRILTLAFWGFVPAIVGARAFYVIGHWQEFQRVHFSETFWAILNVTQGGLVVYGSLIGGLLGFALCLHLQKMPLLATLDLIAPGMLLGLALGRVGCFLNGCCFGGPCDLPWAVHFPAGSPPYVHEVEHGLLESPSLEQIRAGTEYVEGLKIVGPPSSPPIVTEVEPGSSAEAHGLRAGARIVALGGEPVSTVDEAQRALVNLYRTGPWLSAGVADSKGRVGLVRWRASGPPGQSGSIHPTQLYSTIDALVLCFFLLAYGPFARRDGQVLAMLLTVYPITRFLMELLRTDEPKNWSLGMIHLNVGQVASLVILALGAALWVWVLRQRPGRAFLAPLRHAAASGD